jgi:predicted membrane-bound mannosyltransferase
LQKKKELILVVVVVATRGKFKISFFFFFFFFFSYCLWSKKFSFPSRPCVASYFGVCVVVVPPLCPSAAATGSSSRRGRRYSATAHSLAVACIRTVTQLPVHSKWLQSKERKMTTTTTNNRAHKFQSEKKRELFSHYWFFSFHFKLIFG